jgi:hypothetical protein
MTLRPIATSTAPTYPERQADLVRRGGRWLRKVGATVATAAAFGLSGCFIVDVAGDIAPPEYYGCADEEREPLDLDVPGTFADILCEDLTSWGVFETAEQVAVRVSFDAEGLADPTAISADIVGPDGAVVATVTPGAPVELTVTPGTWQIGVSSSYLTEGDFTLHIDLAQDR